VLLVVDPGREPPVTSQTEGCGGGGHAAFQRLSCGLRGLVLPSPRLHELSAGVGLLYVSVRQRCFFYMGPRRGTSPGASTVGVADPTVHVAYICKSAVFGRSQRALQNSPRDGTSAGPCWSSGTELKDSPAMDVCRQHEFCSSANSHLATVPAQPLMGSHAYMQSPSERGNALYSCTFWMRRNMATGGIWGKQVSGT
jgi:hypothetical protein